MAKALDLREDIPHPMGFFVARCQFIKNRRKNLVLRRDKAVEIKFNVHKFNLAARHCPKECDQVWHSCHKLAVGLSFCVIGLEIPRGNRHFHPNDRKALPLPIIGAKRLVH